MIIILWFLAAVGALFIAAAAWLLFKLRRLTKSLERAAVAMEAQRATAVQRFHQAWLGKTILVVPKSRGWHDFATNNVIPILPEGIQLMWWESARNADMAAKDLAQVTEHLGIHERKPFLLRVEEETFGVVPLHDTLVRLRASAKRNPAIQVQAKAVLDSALSDWSSLHVTH